jgi:hypothetical protein
MIEDLGVSEADATRLYAPAGLDIGGETPDEIALAIVAEVQACARADPVGHCANEQVPSTRQCPPPRPLREGLPMSTIHLHGATTATPEQFTLRAVESRNGG